MRYIVRTNGQDHEFATKDEAITFALTCEVCELIVESSAVASRRKAA